MSEVAQSSTNCITY